MASCSFSSPPNLWVKDKIGGIGVFVSFFLRLIQNTLPRLVRLLNNTHSATQSQSPFRLEQKKIIAYQLQEAIQREQLTKASLAVPLETSRATVNRFLDPENESITLLTLKEAANGLGKKLRLELV